MTMIQVSLLMNISKNKTGLMKEIPTLLFSKNDMIYSDKEEHLLKMK